ncbi:TnsD family Tn7-like transposition protein [Proteiniborus sp. MB09-C3]|uniref:TnsD family Tn7-like transposition protein n=1 Tax=Proteiniborus sp. MB09-C3 TaxID=3050072 RepID=UPI0025574679|nr:TnsD family Tn7-like transposition protein [Proteiniborus sp. MB09-C3]WIV12844.1 TnsD family Tn7-like transposition protein [Proteiniborus sp. MB09-C3]
MNFFPTPYPDEILYSTLARYCMRSGNIKEIHNFEDLFGTRNCIAVMELSTQLDALIENMPVGTKYTAEYFIYKHTLFPFLAAFIPKERAEKIIETMRNGEGAVSYMRIGLISNSINLNKYFRFCPECFKEDIERFGEPYWHRSHQVTGVFVCLKHKIPLCDSTELIRAGNRQRFISASCKNCIVEKEISYSNDLMKKMLWMAGDVEILLNNQFGFKKTEWFRNQFRVKLIEKGYARMNNYIHQKKLKQDFVDFYGHEYLALVQSPVSVNSGGWLPDMVRNNDRTTYSIRYLLLARFLEIPVADLFNTKLGSNDEDENNIDAYQELWDQRLIELTQSGLSIREISDILKSSTKTIRKAIDRLEIEEFWKFNGGGKYLHSKFTDTEEFRMKRERLRGKWLEIHAQYPDKSSSQIRKNNDGVYAWLKRYDSEWMEENYRRIKTVVNTVDWDKRDAELLPKVKEVIKEMKEGKPERITWSTVGGKLGISGWLSKRKEKLPLTKAYIDSELESLEEFHIRKIKWGIEELERQGKEITLWNIAETACVKPRYMEGIYKEIKQILNNRGYDCNFKF